MGNLVLEQVTKHYGEHTACSTVSLEIDEGEFFTLLGPSGCGKTTILRMIAGFIIPDSGTISLGGVDITHLEPEKRNVGMVFQNYALFPFMTVQENVEYGLKVQKRSKAEIKEKSLRYLSMVGLEGFSGREISELSGGEQQRVALARSLAIEPSVLLLDEPLSNLDARLRDSMRAELKSLQKNLGITTIFVTHDQTEALSMSDKVAVFEGGICRQCATPEEIYHTPQDSFVAAFVGDTNLFPVHADSDRYFLSNNLALSTLQDRDIRYVSIRPQSIILSPNKTSSDYCFSGIIREKQFHGASTEWIVDVEGLSFSVMETSTISKTKGFGVGTQVHLSFSHDDLHSLKQ